MKTASNSKTLSIFYFSASDLNEARRLRKFPIFEFRSVYLETSNIKLHFLPPYSPNLNPIQRLWKWMKERVVYNTYYKEFEDFKLAIFGFFKLLANTDCESELGQSFRSRVRDKFSPMGAPACV